MSVNSLAIAVNGVSKRYQIVHQEKKSTLAETWLERMKNPFRRPRKEAFQALNNVSFDVQKGEVVGIIGRNGAGKSTLLKILSRITEPTSGEIDLYGRVGSLLEVGTGFHAELTGRENIFLNGAILGMKRIEIQRQFDAIVEFAEVDKFLDTPVKRYSSGMYVRLAFAVAAHLSSDILIMDEVLAVGDAEFQKKCLGKLKAVASSEGRTVLFVSHNMAAIRSLCTQAIFFTAGQIACRGEVDLCVREYLSRNSGQQRWKRESSAAPIPLAIEEVEAHLLGNQPAHQLAIDLRFKSSEAHQAAFMAFDIISSSGIPVMQALPRLEGFISDKQADQRVRVTIDLPPLIPGVYYVTIWAGPHNTITYDQVEEAVAFEITETPTLGRSFPHTTDHGYVVPAAIVSND